MFLVDLFETSTAFKKYNTSINYIPTKGCTNGITFKSRKYWVCHVRRTVEGGYHPSGTCRMGTDTGDPMAVLDSKLRFVKVQNSLSILIFNEFQIIYEIILTIKLQQTVGWYILDDTF